MNIVYIHTHDTGRILQPYGYAVPTPNLMEFCQDAILFRQAFSACPICSPSRSSLLTGQYPTSHGMIGIAHRGFSINDYSKHFVQFIKKHNYHTVLCGMQHEANLIDGEKIIGYDENISSLSRDKMKKHEIYKWDLENADRASEWIKNHAKEKQPFFLSYGCFSTHRPYPDHIKEDINPNYVQPPYPMPDTPETREDFAKFQTMVSYFDQGFGQVIQALKESKLYDKTIIIYTTDHGIANPFCKGMLFDTGIGVSLIMRVPNKIQGKVVDGMVSQVDFFPTICDLLQITKPAHLEGVSFAQAFENPQISLREEIFAEYTFHASYDPQRCIRTKRYKYIRHFDMSYPYLTLTQIEASPVKNMYMENDLREQTKYQEGLYDLLYDPGEHNNLVSSVDHQEILGNLRERLMNHLVFLKDPILKGQFPILNNYKVNTKECTDHSSTRDEDYIGGVFKRSLY